uniref:Transposase n=1 Tax=Heterorhabditis bacteriophora TaxID=37862 RepID=A0A1I7XFM1_HETBA
MEDNQSFAFRNLLDTWITHQCLLGNPVVHVLAPNKLRPILGFYDRQPSRREVVKKKKETEDQRIFSVV